MSVLQHLFTIKQHKHDKFHFLSRKQTLSKELSKHDSTLAKFCYLGRMLHIHRGHMACLPPSMGRETPVMKDAASDAKKAMAFATSIGCPLRPSACVVLQRSKN